MGLLLYHNYKTNTLTANLFPQGKRIKIISVNKTAPNHMQSGGSCPGIAAVFFYKQAASPELIAGFIKLFFHSVRNILFIE
jgi:hypothetical protein